MFALHSVAEACRVLGGLKTIQYVDPNDLVTQPTWNISQSVGALDFKPGKAAFYIAQDRVSGQLVGDHGSDQDGGDLMTYTLSANVRAIRATMESLRAKLFNRRVHIVATYRDDTTRLVPYMRLRIDDTSGTKRGDYQGYKVNGVCKLIMPGPGIAGNIATIPPDTGGDPGTPIPGGGVQIPSITVTSPTHTYTIPAGVWLVGIEIRSTSAQTCAVGLTAGGDELSAWQTLTALTTLVVQGNNIQTTTATPIYFSGLSGTNTIKIWLIG